MRRLLRNKLRSSPLLYGAYKSVCDRHHSSLGVVRESDLVIEGFPRSGNSFAVVAFEMAQGVPVRIAHHWHSPSQFVAAVRYDIPAVLVIRRPKEAVVSYAIYRGSNGLRGMLEEYVGFHRAVMPWLKQVLVADFREITSDFGRVVDRINERFGTDFGRFEHTEANVAEVFRRIEDYQEGEHRFSRPSEVRRQRQDTLRARLQAADLRHLLMEASELYDRIGALSGIDRGTDCS